MIILMLVFALLHAYYVNRPGTLWVKGDIEKYNCLARVSQTQWLSVFSNSKRYNGCLLKPNKRPLLALMHRICTSCVKTLPGVSFSPYLVNFCTFCWTVCKELMTLLIKGVSWL